MMAITLRACDWLSNEYKQGSSKPKRLSENFRMLRIVLSFAVLLSSGLIVRAQSTAEKLGYGPNESC